EKIAVGIAYRRRPHRDPDHPAVAANKAFFDRVEPDIAGHLAAIQLLVGVAIVGMGSSEQPPPQQFIARKAGDRADGLVAAEKAPLRIDLDDPNGGVLVSRVPALLLLPQILLLLAQVLTAAPELLDHALAFGDVLEARHRPHQLALRVEQRIDVDQDGDTL